MRDNPKNSRRIERREFLRLAAGTIAAASALPGRAAGLMMGASPSKTSPFEFPRDFLWGASTSAYQVEGAAGDDGRSPSIWDVFCRKPGAIFDNQTGDVACDHYHRYKEDVALMRSLGLRGYRFSISWSRVLPEGAGKVNSAGLDFYSRLVDELLRAGIVPLATLYHWDLPQALQERGGWMTRDAAGWFGEYTAVVTNALSDRITEWLTINEPRSFLGAGYLFGIHAPGERRPLAEVLRAGHNLFLAHGRGVQAIRAHARRPPQVSAALDISPAIPATNSAADVAAARAVTWGGAPPGSPGEALELWWAHNAWYTDALIRGRYPEEALAILGKDAPEAATGDWETIRQPLDFFALNLYGGWPVRAGAGGKPERVPFPPGMPMTAFNWPVVPEALYWAPKFIHERYGVPIVVTENGLTCRDWIALDGHVHDPDRIDFTTRYLRELRRAMAAGVPVRGYFHWSLMDNFEWAAGYRERFGLTYVDFSTRQRTPKDSASWYAKLIASNGQTLPA